jgi:hypothetical protein
MNTRTKWAMGLVLLLAAAAMLPVQEACALITGGVGNAPMRDPGWPKGAAEIFNVEARVAYWEGPPFGGGQYHAECRGDAKALSKVLVDFAKLDVKSKTIVLHDGAGQSFWLNPNRNRGQKVDDKIDWTFMVWVSDNWQRLRQMPADLNPTNPKDAADGPPSQIDVYTGGNIRWADVVVPQGLKIVDRRLEAKGFTLADGVVLEGNVTDLATNAPLAAKVRLERVEAQPKGGYAYTNVVEMTADAKGHWVLKKAPAGWHRVVAELDGYVPRVIGYGTFDEQPKWHSYDTGLSRPATVSGQITDDAKKPLADAEVRLGDITPTAGGRYQTPFETSFKTDANGRFRTDLVPIGQATVWVYKPGYVRPGLGLPITTPKEDVVMSMLKSSQLQVIIDFTGKVRPMGYIVSIEPEGGSQIGSWGGSGNIDDKNQITFKDVPPGRYVFYGRPNPGNAAQQTESITVELKSGAMEKLTVSAK